MRFCPVGDDSTRRETLTRRAMLARACNHHGGAFNSDAGGTNGTLAPAEFRHPETFHSSQTQPNNQPFSACERSHPLTHTPAPFMYRSLTYPLANPTSPTPLPCSLLRRPPPASTVSPQRSKQSDVAPARATGHGQGLWAAARDHSAGGVSAGGKREEGGGGTRRGGQGIGDLVPRSQRQSKGKRWVKWDRGGGGGEGDGGREQD